MSICHICHDEKHCRACKGTGQTACACRTGQCASCRGRGYHTTDQQDVPCAACNATGICPSCQGTTHVRCAACRGDGYCPTCIAYRRKWKRASEMAKAGDAYNAVTVLQDLLKEFESTKESNTKMGRVGGVGVGALLGSFLLPGVGTIIGSAIGGLLGDALGISETRVSAFAAETHYRLGVIYEMLHNPAALHHYMQARALDTSHALAATALTRLQPTTPVSPQLTALDDDF